MKDSVSEIERYRESSRKAFWRKVFRAESEYLAKALHGHKDVLSVGCGPAAVEAGLLKRGYKVTGLDVSEEALRCAPTGMRAVTGRAEEMEFPDASFDAVIFVASLQFVDDYKKALAEAARVLRPEGKGIIMLLNPASAFFKERVHSAASYVRKIKHRGLKEIERAAARHFDIGTEYLLGIKGERVFKSNDPAEASLYIITGRPKVPGKRKQA